MAECMEVKNVAALQEQIEGVRQDITDVLLEIDHIQLQVNPQIEVDYAVKVGCLENELLQAQLGARRAKRRLALAQARTNRGEELACADIEEELDKELEAWEAQLAARVDDYLSKLESRMESHALSPVEAKELRSLHRELVKRLHPDLHPTQSDDEKRLFAIAQGAYEHGDLEVLRSLELATAYLAVKAKDTPGTDEANGPEAADALYAEYELLLAQLAVTRERLEQLKNTPPYTLRNKLADPAWVHERVEELKAQIAEQHEAKRIFDEKYKQLLEEHHG